MAPNLPKCGWAYTGLLPISSIMRKWEAVRFVGTASVRGHVSSFGFLIGVFTRRETYLKKASVAFLLVERKRKRAHWRDFFHGSLMHALSRGKGNAMEDW